MKKKRSNPERAEQIALFHWARMRAATLPGLELLHSIPNDGIRSPITGHLYKLRGMLPGMPDICLPVPRGKYAALYIELKAGKGRLSEIQRLRLSQLEAVGNAAVPCWGWEQAQRIIKLYLAGDLKGYPYKEI